MLVNRTRFNFWPTFLRAKVDYYKFSKITGAGKEYYFKPKQVYCRVLNRDEFSPNGTGIDSVEYDYTIRLRSEYDSKTMTWRIPIDTLKSIVIYNGIKLRVISIDGINDVVETPNNAIIYLARENGNINILDDSDLFPKESLFPNDFLFPKGDF